VKPKRRNDKIAVVESAEERLHPGFIIAAYAAVSLVAFILLYNQHIQRVRELNEEMSSRIPQFHPHNDWLLGLLIGGLFLLPTLALIWMIRESEPAYTTYSRILLALSITAPLGVLFFIGSLSLGTGFLFGFCFYRFFASPSVIVGLLASRICARFSKAKRLISYALAIEAVTLVAAAVFMAYALKALSALH
jgi:hypothetical protein